MAAATAEEVLQSLIDTLDLCSEKVKGSLMFSANRISLSITAGISLIDISLGNRRGIFKPPLRFCFCTLLQREAWDKLWKTWS